MKIKLHYFRITPGCHPVHHNAKNFSAYFHRVFMKLTLRQEIEKQVKCSGIIEKGLKNFLKLLIIFQT